MTVDGPDAAHLYYRQGSSDKEYHARIEETPGGFLVQVAWGRRGSTLQTGTKTQAPVSREQARKIFDKLVAEKFATGYTPAESGQAFAGTERAGEVSGLLPQLLNPVPEEAIEGYFVDPEWGLEEKLDGRRRMVRLDAEGNVVGSNRKGLIVPLPEEVVAQLATRIRSDELPLTLDGELVGARYYIFDVIELAGESLAARPYRQRMMVRGGIAARLGMAGAATCLPTHTAEPRKREAFARLKAAGAEGVVFKRLTAAYTVGRPNQGGDQVKYKFTQSCTCAVFELNDRRSVLLAVRLRDTMNQVVCVGNVTIPPNREMPRRGQLVEVRYLYAYPTGSLYQPIYLGVRDDVDQADAFASLKFKVSPDEPGAPGSEEEEEGNA